MTKPDNRKRFELLGWFSSPLGYALPVVPAQDKTQLSDKRVNMPKASKKIIVKALVAAGIVLLLSGVLLTAVVNQLKPSGFSSNIGGISWVVLGLVSMGVVSFGLARVRLSHARVRVIFVAFLVVGIVAPTAFAIVYLLPGQVSGTSVSRPIVVGNIVVPLGAGNGTLTLEVTNVSANTNSITAMTFSNQGLENVTTISTVGNLVLKYQGIPVSTSNPLPPGENASGSLNVSNLAAGVAYEMQIVASFGNGSQVVQTVSITSQL